MNFPRRTFSSLSYLTPFLFVPLNTSAATGGAPQLPASPVSLGGMLQVALGLVLVLAAIAATAWLLKRFGPAQTGAGGAIKVLGGVAVGPRERLVLVEVGETWLVVGVAQGHVSAVHSMARPEQDFTMPEPAKAESGFPSWLKQAIQGRRGGQV